jgi:hypothetical protein
MRRYRLSYDDGTTEYVDADSPSEAVAKRTHSRIQLPSTITDETAIREWISAMPSRAGVHSMPLRSRIMDEPVNEDAPLRNFTPKDTTGAM